MDWLVILEIILLAIIISSISLYFYLCRDMSKIGKWGWKWVVSLVSVLFIFLMLIAPWSVYCSAINLPAQYICACDTVEESKELLMRYENLTESWGSLGQGLESMELKVDIKDAIVKRNMYKQQIISWLNNPMSPYKDLLRANLPDDWEY